MKLEIDEILDVARQTLDTEAYDKLVDSLNQRVKELKEEDDEPDVEKKKVEWQYYAIYDSNNGEEVGSSPLFTLKASAETDPSQIPAILQSAIGNVHTRLRSMKKKRKSQKLESLSDLASLLKKADFTDGVVLKFVSKEPTIPYPIQFDFNSAK